MTATHNIRYQGLDLEVSGEYEEPDNETGYRGGWLTYLVKINDVEISEMLNEQTLKEIDVITLEQNY